MPFNRSRTIGFLSSIPETNRLSDQTSTNNGVRREVQNTLNDTLASIDAAVMMEGIEFALWNDIWNKYGYFGSKKNQVRNQDAGRTHGRGRLLSIDYGYHTIGSEMSQNHLGIVLYSFKHFVVVAPVTSDTGQTFPESDKDAIVRIKKTDYPQFNSDSVILLQQIRSFDKNRIRSSGNTISGTTLMVEIETKLAELYSPYVSKQYKDEIRDLRDRLTQAEKKVAELEAAAIMNEAALAERVKEE